MTETALQLDLSIAFLLAVILIQMADGYPAEREFADSVEKTKDQIKAWPYSRISPSCTSCTKLCRAATPVTT